MKYISLNVIYPIEEGTDIGSIIDNINDLNEGIYMPIVLSMSPSSEEEWGEWRVMTGDDIISNYHEMLEDDIFGELEE